MNVAVFTDVKPEDKDAILAILDKLGATDDDTVVSETKRKKTRSEINHQNYLNRKARQSEKSDSQTKEKREEKEEVLPLSSPSSLSSSPSNSPNNNPITPYNPPLPEEREERKESEADVEKASRTASRRGELKAFGTHVKLSEKEFLSLQEKFGYEKALEKIEWMNNYIGEDPKRERVYQSRNHYLTLLNWDRMDQERKQKPQAAEQPKEETWMEVAERIQRERDAKKELIDL